MLNDADVAINLKLLKLLRFYHIFDPCGPKIFGQNVYWLMYLIWTAIVQCLIVYGSVGYLVDMDDAVSDVDVIMVFAQRSSYCHVLWQAYTFLYRADVVWEVFDVARLNFLKSKGRMKNVISTLCEERARSIRFTNLYFGVLCAILIQWIVFPLAMYRFDNSKNLEKRVENIGNLRFPVNVPAYNQHYGVYYTMELIAAIYFTFSSLTLDVFTISICRVLAVQYEILSQVFETVGGYDDPGPRLSKTT